LSFNAYSQQNKVINGKVTDEHGNPLAGVSVYLSLTSKGVTTSNEGEFKLKNLPEGKYDLVVSAIGYEPKVISVSSNNYSGNLQISLTKRVAELAEVVVQATDKNGWRKYGKYFFDNFIGTTRNAKFCKIINRDVIRFRFSEKNNRLTAKADEPIIIENRILGYRISFQLIEFTADFNTDVVSYYGYPFFSDLNQSDENGKAISRHDAYHGSLMHFLRAAYEDRVKDKGFIVKTTIVRPNLEKERVRKVLNDSTHMRHTISNLSFGVVKTTSGNENTISGDSLSYYKKVVKQRDTLTQNVKLESLNEMLTDIGANSKFLFFKNPMEVDYSGKRSEIMLRTPVALEILKNGSYFPPTELITFKYWSKQEKICNMLPLDYYPQ
jgi:hypothetical protein